MTPPNAIGPYEIVRPLAEGGMGQVFLARKTGEGGFEMTCVVKTIRAAQAGQERYVRMFLREARILASLRHQNIVQVLDFGRADDALFLAMEYIEGRDLREVMQRARSLGAPLPLGVALRIAIEALKGLDYAHRRTGPDGRRLDIIHRDLTPTNILLSREGEVKLVDFGIAKDATSEGFTEAGVIKGKWHYLAPEQLEGRPLDARVDLFGMGVVLYEMATGRKPFDAETTAALLAKILSGEFPPASSVAGTPPELDRIAALALARQPEGRFESAAAMISALEKLAGELEPLPSSGLRDYYRELFDSPREEATGAAAEEDSFHEGNTVTSASSVQPTIATAPVLRRAARRPTKVWAAGLAAAAAIVAGIWAMALHGLWKPTAAPPAPAVPLEIAAPEKTPAPAENPAPPPPTPVLTKTTGADLSPPPKNAALPEPPKNAGPPAPSKAPPPAPAAALTKLAVSSQPPTKVTVNGADLGWTPRADVDIKVGPNTIVMVREEYGINYATTIEGVSGETVKLRRQFTGTLQATACPDCAILADNKNLGSGAVTAALTAGQHAISAVQGGQVLHSTVVLIKDGQTTAVNLLGN
jgi:serine/threonine-protein kinase